MLRERSGSHQVRTATRSDRVRRPLAEELEDRVTPTVSIVNGFAGLAGGGDPPDTVGAAGPSSYIETINSSVAIFNKDTGATIASDGLNDFLFTVGGITPVGSLSDATMAYDEVTGQFVVGDLDVNSSDGSALDIAVSKTSNPTTLDGASWTFYQIDTHETNEAADYPGNFGFNADAFVFTYNMFDLGGGSNHTEVVALSQSSLAAGGNVGGLRFDESGFSYRPVTMHDSAAGGPMWFVQEGGGDDSINLHRIDNILTAPATTTFNIAVNAYNSINPPLNPDGSTITTNIDTRIMKAAEANNTIVATQHVGVGSNEDDARWYEFNVSDVNNPFLVHQGNVGFGAGTYVAYPSIDINAVGDIGLAASFSGTNFSTEYMSAFVTGMNPSDGGTMEGSFYIANGDSNNVDGRMGDFSGINVDPNGSFWTAQEITLGSHGATTIANFTLSNNGESFVKNGVLEVTGTNANDNVTLKPNPGNFGQTEVLDNGIDLGDFNNGSFSSINVALFGGNDSLTLADTGGSSGLDFFGGVPLTYDGGSGTNSVLLDDSTANFSDTYTITSNTVSRPFFGGLTYSNVQGVTLKTETGNDTVNVVSTASSTPVTIDEGGGTDAVIISPTAQFLDNIQGNVTVNGGVGVDTLTIDDQADPFSDVYTMTGSSLTRTASALISYNLMNVVTVNGGSGADTFNIVALPGAAVNLNTGAGNDTVNLQATSGTLAVNGQGGTNTLVGPNVAQTWNITGANAGTVGVASFSNVQDLTAGTSFDTFKFGPSGSVAGTIVGLGFDTLDYSGNGGAAITVNLATGTATSTGGFTGFGTLVGSTSTANTLIGTNQNGDLWFIDGPNSGAFNGFTFSGIDNLTGGTGNDTFKFATGGSVLGKVNGGGGTNTLDYSNNGGAAITVNLTTDTATATGGIGGVQALVGSTSTADTLVGSDAANVWSITGANAGTLNTFAFSAIEILTGGAGNDTFKFGPGGSVAGKVSGGSGGFNTLDYSGDGGAAVTLNLSNDTATATGGIGGVQSLVGSTSAADTLIGGNVTNAWSITGANAGTLNTFAFSAIENLTGGTGADTFKFGPGGSVAGKVSGGGGADVLNYSGNGGAAITVNLATNAATSTGGIAGIGTLVGSTSTANTLVGPNATNAWSITASNAGTLNTFAFSAIANLTGGTGMDVFLLGNGKGVTGKINGSGGGDFLDYSPYTTAVTVNLATGAATGIDGGAAGGATNVQNVRGGSGGNTLTGNAQGNILIGGAGADTITGGTGRSLLIGDKGADKVTGGTITDIIIGGYTSYDSSTTANDLALESILAEWQSTDLFATRVSKIKAGVGTGKLDFGVTVFDDGSANTMTGVVGSPPKNWFFKGAHDTITDPASAGQIN